MNTANQQLDEKKLMGNRTFWLLIVATYFATAPTMYEQRVLR
jgi:hypothetical protein